MKISDATIMVSAHNDFEQMDLMRREESRIHPSGTAPGSSNNRSISTGKETPPFPVMVVDRVSLSRTRAVEYQSGYAGKISSRSAVRSADAGDITVFEQKELVETLVGGVIDRAVVARQLEQGETIQIDTQNRQPSPRQILSKQSLSKQFLASGSISSRLSGEKSVSLKQTDIRFEAEQMTFAAAGEVVTEDGRTIAFSLDLSMDRAFLSKKEQTTLIHTWQEQVILTDPLVISLDGGLPKLSDTRFEFDLDNDGDREEVNFAAIGSGFLAFDRNNDQRINNGSELFGPGTGNGFEELAALDKDQNGWIDENDAVFSKLSVWTKDENGEDHLMSLKDAGIGAIFLENAATRFDMTSPDNTLKGRLKSSGMFLFEDGNIGSIQQIDLAARPIEEDKKEVELNLAVNKPVSGASASDRVRFLTPQPVKGAAGSLAEEPVQNPLAALTEKIKALREEMDLILGKKPSFHGLGRFGGGPGKKNGFSPSKYHLYQMINPDPFVLAAGRKMEMVQDRYA